MAQSGSFWTQIFPFESDSRPSSPPPPPLSGEGGTLMEVKEVEGEVKKLEDEEEPIESDLRLRFWENQSYR